jgi:ABC-2 type transport system ATP-binding protein
VFGFLDPNSAGKSTTIRLLLGLNRRPGLDLRRRRADVAAAHRLLAYVPADVALWPV